MITQAFEHTDVSTPESCWLAAPEWDTIPTLDVARIALDIDRLVVAAAHPDDETLGAGGLIGDLAAVGIEVVVVLATEGEASHPRSATWSREMLAATRRTEFHQAMACLAPEARLVHLALPDGSLRHRTAELVHELSPLLTERTLVLAPWTHDAHPDHDTLGAAAIEATEDAGAVLLMYPIWLWHWGRPDDVPWQRGVVTTPTTQALARKSAALQCYQSQVNPLSPLRGDEPVVDQTMIRRADRLFETWLTPDGARFSSWLTGDADPEAARAGLEAMYDDSDDPWGFADSFYESRKRDLLLSMLRRPHYRRILEIGCADGHLTRHLVERADQVTALEISARAVARLRARDLRGVEIVRGAAPYEIPEGPFDLVLLSEVGYFLQPMELIATLRRAQECLAPDGELVLAHWQHPTSGLALDGPAVHRCACEALALPHTASYDDADVRIDVWGGSVSLAGDEGRR